MHNIPPDKLRQIRDALRRPEGTFLFDFSSEELFNPEHPGGIVFEMTSGKHYYRVERDEHFELKFFHSSPGTGTRVASIDCHAIVPGEKIRIIFSWCPDEIQLVAGPTRNAKGPAIGKGAISPRQFHVGEDGAVHQIGDKGVEVMGVYVYQGDRPVLRPTAVHAWEETLKALEFLHTGESDIGYVYELVVCNLSLSILATGFEAYAKARFIELIHEGIEPDSDALIDEILGKKDRTEEQKKQLALEAHEKAISIPELLAQEGRINFLSYNKCKAAYNKGYGIKFGDLELQKDVLNTVKRCLAYRHKIVHVSPLLGCLNLGETPPDPPALPSRKLAQAARESFTNFVAKLHEATLSLRP